MAKGANIPVLIGEIVSDDAELRLLPKSADKDPHMFAIHHLVMQSVGLDRPAKFNAQLPTPFLRAKSTPRAASARGARTIRARRRWRPSTRSTKLTWESSKASAEFFRPAVNLAGCWRRSKSKGRPRLPTSP